LKTEGKKKKNLRKGTAAKKQEDRGWGNRNLIAPPEAKVWENNKAPRGEALGRDVERGHHRGLIGFHKPVALQVWGKNHLPASEGKELTLGATRQLKETPLKSPRKRKKRKRSFSKASSRQPEKKRYPGGQRGGGFSPEEVSEEKRKRRELRKKELGK